MFLKLLCFLSVRSGATHSSEVIIQDNYLETFLYKGKGREKGICYEAWHKNKCNYQKITQRPVMLSSENDI